MSIRRGALVVLEGCDRAGKSTQAKMLITALNNCNIPVELYGFPNRTTAIGEIINNFLTKKIELPSETVHLLFSANRWECKDEILKTLYKGTTLIIDRYAASGAAYTAAITGKNLNWCKEPDSGLPSPDLVIYLSISKKSQSLRSNWGDERFENVELQELVASNYEKLIDKTWYVINADNDKSVIHSQILEKVINTIKNIEHLPIEKLYESDKNS